MILFRIDLSIKEGLGHYNRVKSLIKYLNLKKYKIIVDNLPNISFFKTEINNILPLYEANRNFVSEKNDALLFLKLIKEKFKNPVVIKDSYRLGYNWEKSVYRYCKKLVSIVDFPQKKYYVDYHINHSPSFSIKDEKILKKIKINNKKKCTFLLGPNYALFNSSINKKKIISDLVFYNGGSGNVLIYEKVIKKILKNTKKKTKVILIAGPFVKNYKLICQKFNIYKNINIIYKPKNILNIVKGTKVFISSAGVSMFESSFLKIPTLLFKMNKNQTLDDKDCEKLGHYFSLEKKDLNFVDKIANLISLMLKNNDKIKKMMFNSSLNIKTIKKKYQKHLKI